MEKNPAPLPLLDDGKGISFLIICLLAFALLFVKKSFIEDETAAFEFLQGKPEGSILALRSALQYLTIPLVYAWKFLVLGFVIWVGCFSFGYRVTFGKCWRAVTAAELIFFVPELIKIMWFMFIETDPDFFRINSFYPLSLINFFDTEKLDPEFLYPLKSLNLFEIPYCILLVTGLKHYTRKPTREVSSIVLMTYLPLFLLWLAFYLVVY